jgi:hypothetical protein
MQDTDKQCEYVEMPNTAADVTGLLKAVTEVIETLQSFNPNSAKRHKDYSLLSACGVRETMNHGTTIHPSAFPDPRSLIFPLPSLPDRRLRYISKSYCSV